jgi:hypothetical protein
VVGFTVGGVPAVPAAMSKRLAMRDTLIFIVILSVIVVATLALVFFGMPR